MLSLYSTETVIDQVRLMPELMETEIPSNLKLSLSLLRIMTVN